MRMNLWLYNDSWDDFKKSPRLIGFQSERERAIISKGDKIVYASSGIVAGTYEAGDSVQNRFTGWSGQRPFQIMLLPVLIPSQELVAKPLRYKVQLERPFPGAKNLFRLSEQEFGKIELAIKERKKELVY